MIDEIPDRCTICDADFYLGIEGGAEGAIGMIPVTFCPTCKSGILDLAYQDFYQELDESLAKIQELTRRISNL